MAILEFYVSGFWTWLGLTIGLSILCGSTWRAVASMGMLFRK